MATGFTDCIPGQEWVVWVANLEREVCTNFLKVSGRRLSKRTLHTGKRDIIKFLWPRTGLPYAVMMRSWCLFEAHRLINQSRRKEVAYDVWCTKVHQKSRFVFQVGTHFATRWLARDWKQQKSRATQPSRQLHLVKMILELLYVMFHFTQIKV